MFQFSKQFFLKASVALTLWVVSIPSAAQEVTLKDAIQFGLANNPEYGVVANTRMATEKELRQARGLFLPSLDLTGDTGLEYTDDPNTRAGIDPDDEETLFRYQVGLTLTQLLFDGFNAKSEVERQVARVRSSAHRVDETAEFVGLDIVEAYLEVMRQRELLQIARENIDSHLDIMAQTKDAVYAGKSTEADLAQVEARLARANATESQTKQALRNAESQYKAETGEMPGDLTLTPVPLQNLAANVEEAVRRAIVDGPTVKIFEADIEVAEAEQKQTESSFYPQVNLQLDAANSEDVGGVEGYDTSGRALVTMNWNLFRGGIDTARRKEFIYRSAVAKEQRADAARAIEDDVRQTWASMVAEGDQAREFYNQSLSNQTVVRSYRDQFELGRRTLLDVLDAQNEHFVSRSNTINAEYLEMLAMYRLMALQGRLLDSMNIQPLREASLTDLSDTNPFN